MNATATYLSNRLLTLPTGAGWVHSVFRQAVNVVLDGTLLTFLPDAGAGLPDSIVLTAADFAILREASCDEPVLMRSGTIAIPQSRITIQIGDNHRNNAFPPGGKLAPAAERIQRRERVRRDLVGFRADMPPQVKQRSAELANALGNHDLPACERIAASLVGLGNGLTPSGDDVLLGVLAVLRFLTESGATAPFFTMFAAAVVKLAEGNTTDVSLKYLRCAGQGRFSLPLIAGVRSFYEAGHAIDMVNLARLVSAGDTSGSDILNGIVLGIHGVCDAEI